MIHNDTACTASYMIFIVFLLIHCSVARASSSRSILRSTDCQFSDLVRLRGGGGEVGDSNNDNNHDTDKKHVLHDDRDMASLLTWAKENGVFLSDDIRLEQDKQSGIWGVTSRLAYNVADDERITFLYMPHNRVPVVGKAQQRVGRMKVPNDNNPNSTSYSNNNAGDFDCENFGVVMRIPSELVISSTMLKGIEYNNNVNVKPSSIQERVKGYLRQHYDDETASFYYSHFSLVLVFLHEYSKGEKSLWYPYFHSLPKPPLQTVHYWNEREMNYARKLGLTNTFESAYREWEAFVVMLNEILPHATYDPDHVKWAFATCMTRAWKASYKASTGESVYNLVCIADMFNHRYYSNVMYEQDSVDSPVEMIQIDHDSDDDGLYMSYGNTNLARFPVIYGFCDTSCPTIPALIIINSFTDDSNILEAAKIFGFTSTDAMVLYTEDGAISDRVWNAILYRILLDELRKAQGSKERLRLIQSELDILYKACRKKPQGPMIELLEGDEKDALDHLHYKYRQEMIEDISWYVKVMLDSLPNPEEETKKILEDASGGENCTTSNWNMLREFNEHIRKTYLNVQEHMETSI